nr:hypothetical protein [Tanacetum cinerariifolium]
MVSLDVGLCDSRGVKEKENALVDDSTKVNHHADEVTSRNMAPITTNASDVNTENLETPLESHKGDDINYNPNVETTPSASLPNSVSFATLLKGDTSRKSANFHTLITPAGNGADVAVPLESIRVFSSKDCLDAMLDNVPSFIRNNPLILKKWDPDVNLLKEDVGNVPVWVKLHGVPMTAFNEDKLSVITTKLGTSLMLDSYTSDMFEYEWKPPKCLSCKVFGHVLNECPKKIVSDVAKNLNNPRQATRGVPVGPKISFQSTKQIYIPISNKNGASTSGKKKQAGVSRQKVSNSNPFDGLNSIEIDDDLGTNGGDFTVGWEWVLKCGAW